jgi:hypothetical protein
MFAVVSDARGSCVRARLDGRKRERWTGPASTNVLRPSFVAEVG